MSLRRESSSALSLSFFIVPSLLAALFALSSEAEPVGAGAASMRQPTACARISAHTPPFDHARAWPFSSFDIYSSCWRGLRGPLHPPASGRRTFERVNQPKDLH